jgi:hypothetical protein
MESRSLRSEVDFQPSIYSVVCGRRKFEPSRKPSLPSSNNVHREIFSADSKTAKSAIVSEIITMIRQDGRKLEVTKVVFGLKLRALRTKKR